MYFGSFNPIHSGHVGLAKSLLSNQDLDEFRFLVSPNNPLKEAQDLAEENARLEMLNIALKDIPGAIISDMEFGMPRPSYTIDSLRKIKSMEPEADLILLIGSDNALIFDQWKDWQSILNEFKVWVYPRRNYDFVPENSPYPEMTLLETPYFDVSSTMIREAVRSRMYPEGLVDPLVWDYLLKNKLYI